MTKEHKTQRGALLASLEWSKLGAQHYLIEGREVYRVSDRRRWFVDGTEKHGWFDSFTEALEWIAEQTVAR